MGVMLGVVVMLGTNAVVIQRSMNAVNRGSKVSRIETVDGVYTEHFCVVHFDGPNEYLCNLS